MCHYGSTFNNTERCPLYIDKWGYKLRYSLFVKKYIYIWIKMTEMLKWCKNKKMGPKKLFWNKISYPISRQSRVSFGLNYIKSFRAMFNLVWKNDLRKPSCITWWEPRATAQEILHSPSTAPSLACNPVLTLPGFGFKGRTHPSYTTPPQPFIHPSDHPPTHPFIHWCIIYPPTHSSIHPSSIHPPIHNPSIHHTPNPFIHLHTHSSYSHSSIHPSIHPSLPPSLSPSHPFNKFPRYLLYSKHNAEP